MERKILTFASIFVIFFSAFLLADVDIENPTECPKGMDASAKNICCTHLNNKRLDYSTCCQYPGLVIFSWQYDACFAECFSISQLFNIRCCILECGLRFLKVLGIKPSTEGIDVDGLKFSFLLSVDNDTRWSDAISSSVDTCAPQFRLDVPQIANVTDPDKIQAYENFWDCFETVPKYLYSIIDCAYFANFLKCPTYNLETDGCDMTKQYVQDCLINKDE